RWRSPLVGNRTRACEAKNDGRTSPKRECRTPIFYPTAPTGGPFSIILFPPRRRKPDLFFDWAERLGPKIECVCVQYPGRGSRLREKPLFSVHDLVEEIGKGFPAI